MMSYNTEARTYEETGLNSYLVRVFTKMGLGLLVTALVAAVSYFSGFYYTFMSSLGGMGYLLLVIVEFGVVIGLSSRLTTMQTTTANLLFYVYAAITGFTFTSILYTFDVGVVGIAFAFSAVLFFSCAIIGHTTNRDLSRFSTIFMGGLIALILASVFAMFIPALANSLVLTYIGIILFMGLTAWDMQRVKQLYYVTNGEGQVGENLAVYGAFELYLDFINIFLYVLQIFGSSRNSRN